MKKGGMAKNPEVEQIVRFGGLFLPIIALFYGVLVSKGALDQSHFVGFEPFITIATMLVALGIIQFIAPPRSARLHALALTAYHILAACYILYVSGLQAPMTIIWLALLLATYVYLQAVGLWVSASVLVAVAVADVLLHPYDEASALSNITSIIAIISVASIILGITRAHDSDKQALLESRAKESLQRDRTLALVNNLADGILSVDQHGVIQVFNAAALNLLDTNTSLTGKSLDSVLKCVDETNKRVKLTPELHRARSVVNREDLSVDITGEPINLSLTYSPIRSANSSTEDAGKDGYILILRDITKQKSLEEERDEFISVVSHELRTPLTVAEGSLSNTKLILSRPDIPNETVAKSVDLAHEQIVFLARMVNDLSTLSRAERGTADAPELIPVEPMIHEIYNEYLKQAKEKRLAFDLALGQNLGSVSASPLYLKELLQNFVTNAIKYTAEGSVTIEVTKPQTDMLRFAIHDTGIGISKADQARIFEKFYRAEDYRTRETGGTGLGLYVARKLSHKLGTTIFIKSRLNHGSSFWFDLPVAKSDKK